MDDFGRSAIGFIGVSLACCTINLVTISLRGGNDWSHALVALFYGALICAFITGLLGMILTFCSALPGERKRTLALLSLPGILCPVWLLIAIMSLASEMR